MQIPLALRALGRAPLRRLRALVTRDPSLWVPSDARPARLGTPAHLAASTTASAVRAAVIEGTAIPAVPGNRPACHEQAFVLARHAGYFSPTLLDWCLRQVENAGDVVYRLRINPAVTPSDMRAARGFLEERAWRMVLANRVGNLPRPFATDVTELALAWLLARHPAERHVPCPPFMATVLAHGLGDHRVLRAVFTLPELPAVVRQTLRHLAAADDFATIREICRHAPQVMTPQEIEDLVLQDRPVSRPWFVLELFDVLPAASRNALWREAFKARPHQAAVAMAAYPGTRWTGLTAHDLAPLLAHPSADVRLVAIQLLSSIPGAEPAPGLAPHATGSDQDRVTGEGVDRAPGPLATPRPTPATPVPPAPDRGAWAPSGPQGPAPVGLDTPGVPDPGPRQMPALGTRHRGSP